MKTTSRILLTVIALFIIGASTVSAKGGGSGRLSVGANLAMPMGTFGDAFGMGFGGTVRYEMPMGDNLGLMGTVGFLSMGAKEDGGATETLIPIQVGAKYYFMEQQSGFYGAFQLGVHSWSYSYTTPGTPAVVYGGVTVYPATPETTTDVSGTDLSYAPGVGYHLANLDFGLNYQIISGDGGSSSYLDIRLAYVFGGN